MRCYLSCLKRRICCRMLLSPCILILYLVVRSDTFFLSQSLRDERRDDFQGGAGRKKHFERETWSSALRLTFSYQRKNEAIDFLSVSLSAGNIKTDSKDSHVTHPQHTLLLPPDHVCFLPRFLTQCHSFTSIHNLTSMLSIPTLPWPLLIWCPPLYFLLTDLSTRSLFKWTAGPPLLGWSQRAGFDMGWRVKRYRD